MRDRISANDKTGLALSGGGVRAAAFHLGVLDKLNELNILSDIDVISTVSGGSITGAYFVYNAAGYNDFREKMIANLKKSIECRIVFNWRIIAAIVNPYYSRTNVLSAVYDDLYFKKSRISELPEKPELQINATNLATGKNWRFSKNIMGDWKIGVSTKTDKIKLADAVASSSAVPGIFHPYNLKVRKYFDKPAFDAWRIGLCDGGVYDNQGTHVLMSDYNGRVKCRNIICSDASAPFDDKVPKISLRLFKVLMRQNNVMMDRIKNMQYQRLLYAGIKDEFNTAYFSIDWTINKLIKYFVKQEELSRKLDIWKYIEKFKGQNPDNIPDAEFETAKQSIIKTINYPEMHNPLDDETVKKLAGVGTRLFSLSDEEIKILTRHGSDLCGFQVKTYLPELVKK